MSTTSETRVKLDGEITPIRSEQSHTKDDNEWENGAQLAIDLDYDTASFGFKDSDGNNWLKLSLDKVHCVKGVIWYWPDGNTLIR